MKLEKQWHSTTPSRLCVGKATTYRNGFTLEKGTHGQHTLKLEGPGSLHSQVTFIKKLVSTGYRLSRVEYVFFRGAEEPLRFNKLRAALEHASDVVAARDAARRLRGEVTEVEF